MAKLFVRLYMSSWHWAVKSLCHPTVQVDVTEIFRQIPHEKKVRMVSLLVYLVVFVITIYKCAPCRPCAIS